jgi:hypothetical protein
MEELIQLLEAREEQALIDHLARVVPEYQPAKRPSSAEPMEVVKAFGV